MRPKHPSPNDRKANVLLLCCENARHIGTVEDHISAFHKFSRHNFHSLDSYITSRLDLNLELFDAIVFHYSIVIAMDSYLPPAFAQRLAQFKGHKILYIQDEYRWVDQTSDAIHWLGIGVIFTVVNKDVVRRIYRDPCFDSIRFEHTLTGFVPEELLSAQVPEYEKRPIDVSYRARKLPFWCGSLGQQKWQIGARFLKDAEPLGLKCDIAMSETSRIYGQAWIDFIANSKAVLGTESGVSFIDYTGDVLNAIDSHVEAHPEAAFEEVRDMFLEGRDGEVAIHVISPRCFEAAALRTLMILYPGDYSGILKPWQHYVLLEPDHSNIEEVVRTLRDTEKAREIIDNAYREIACSDKWSFATMVRHFDQVLGEILVLETKDQTAQQANAPSEQCSISSNEQQIAAEFTSFMKAYDRAKVTSMIRYRSALMLQRAAEAIRDGLTKYLPRPVALPLVAIGRTIARKGRPFFRRFLLQ